jgi:molybdopterin-guanine dinucleotide biosynthesis protein B
MFGKIIIAVVGSTESGKTTTVEILIKGLTEKGFKIASAKRIHEPDFTIDTNGKDTWRHAKAGACTVVSVAANELAVIKKVDTKKCSLKQIVAEFPNEIDIIILEGFKTLVGEDSSIPKLVTAKTNSDITTALECYKNILGFIGSVPERITETEIPFVDVLKDPEKVVDLVYQKVGVLVERKRIREEKITIQVNEELLPIGDFVQNILRKTVLAMISSLKGVKIKGDEKILIFIKRLSRG